MREVSDRVLTGATMQSSSNTAPYLQVYWLQQMRDCTCCFLKKAGGALGSGRAYQVINVGGAKLSDDHGEQSAEAALAGVAAGGGPAKGLLQHVPQICAVRVALPALQSSSGVDLSHCPDRDVCCWQKHWRWTSQRTAAAVHADLYRLCCCPPCRIRIGWTALCLTVSASVRSARVAQPQRAAAS